MHVLSYDREVSGSKTFNSVIGVVFFVLATALGAYVRIPVPGSPVPITLQTFFVLLSGAILGKRLGVLSQAAYIFLGAAGLPIFQGYAFGVSHIFGPTGGYLVGFMAASFLTGKMLEKGTSVFYKILASFIVASAVLYTLGVLWLISIYRISLVNAVAIGVLPFISVEIVKVLTAAFLYRRIEARSKSIFS